MVRRTIALGGAIVLIILLVLGLNSCLDSRKDRAFRDYANDVRAIVRGSNDISQSFFDLLSSPSAPTRWTCRPRSTLSEPTRSSWSSARAIPIIPTSSTARTAGSWRRCSSEPTRSRRWPRPCPRRSAINAARATPINAIAGQMQALLASDVIYLQRTVPGLLSAYKEQGIEETFPTDRFLPDLGWLDPDTVQTRLGRISGGDSQRGDAGAARHRHPERHGRARRASSSPRVA